MSMNRISLTGLLAFLALAGCATNETLEPPKPLVEFNPYYQLEEVWSVSAAEDTEDLYLGLQPASDGERVYVASFDGTVTAYDLETGDEVWSRDLTAGGEGWFELAEGLELSAGPGVGEGLVAVGTSNGEVALLDAEDGSVRWVEQVSSEVLAAPAIADGLVVVRSVDGRLSAYSVEGAARQWTYEQPVPDLSLRGNAEPVVEDGVVYAGFDNGHVAALELAGGELLWDQVIARPSGRTELDRMVDVDGRMALRDDSLYAVAYHGRLVALDPRSGQPYWDQERSSYQGLDADWRAVYVTDQSSDIWAHDNRSGNVLWTSEELHARRLTAPVRYRDTIAVGDFEGYVHLLSTDTGLMLARAETDGAIINAPIVAGDYLIVQTEEGGLYAFRITDA